MKTLVESIEEGTVRRVWVDGVLFNHVLMGQPLTFENGCLVCDTSDKFGDDILGSPEPETADLLAPT